MPASTDTAGLHSDLERTPLLTTRASHDFEPAMPPSPSSQHHAAPPTALSLIANSSFTGVSALVAQAGLALAGVTLAEVIWAHPAGALSLFSLTPLRPRTQAHPRRSQASSRTTRASRHSPSSASSKVGSPVPSLGRADELRALTSPLALAGILLLQPQPSTAAHKKKGLQVHQVFQYTSAVAIAAGAAFIVYNKAAHGGPSSLLFFPFPRSLADAALALAAKHIQTWHATFGLIVRPPHAALAPAKRRTH